MQVLSVVLIKTLHQHRPTMQKTLGNYLAHSDPMNHFVIMKRKFKNLKKKFLLWDVI